MSYRDAFAERHGYYPYAHQERVADALFAGRNVVLRAPTGSGKTKAVLTPFLVDGWRHRPTRLIYALPLRSLVQQIRDEVLGLLGDENLVTIQTGEQPDDEFFARGRVIITTYDQLLSGLLGAPYGLSHRQSNVNCAAVAGALVVFDEFHLMDLDSAFLTGAAALALFKSACQSVWMTATATAGPTDLLTHALDCERIVLTPEAMSELPVVATTRRELRYESEPLSPAAIQCVANHGRVVAIVNTVDRAQRLYEELAAWAAAQTPPIPCGLLHARYFKSDRDERTARLTAQFGPKTRGPAILVATQVVEAGVDISCEHLFTDLCPMNALLQRAGRCARFEHEQGVVHVHGLPEPNGWRPYDANGRPAPSLASTEDILREKTNWDMSPDLAETWVERVHGERDRQAIDGLLTRRRDQIRNVILDHLTRSAEHQVGELIRPDDGSMLRLIIAGDDHRPERPSQREALPVARYRLTRLVREHGGPLGWWWTLGAENPAWEPMTGPEQARKAFIVCLPPEAAGYSELGLRLGQPGTVESPARVPPPRPGYRPLREELWTLHTERVTAAALDRWQSDGGPDGLLVRLSARLGLTAEGLRAAVRACALLHDLGKLQSRWQDWAARYQRTRNPAWEPKRLAHTDFDSSKRQDWDLSRSIKPPRGTHAIQSAWYALPTVVSFLQPVSREHQPRVAAACLAAIVAHHGGWIPRQGPTLDVDRLVAGWEDLFAQVTGTAAPPEGVAVLDRFRDRQRDWLKRHLDAAVGDSAAETWWPLVAYLTRTLRLSDWHATEEGASHD